MAASAAQTAARHTYVLVGVISTWRMYRASDAKTVQSTLSRAERQEKAIPGSRSLAVTAPRVRAPGTVRRIGAATAARA
jgi:hypothetical protein